MVTISESEQALTEEEFNDFQTSLGKEIPGEYKSFILENNGGCVFPDLFIKEDDQREFRIHQFYSIKYGDLKVEQVLENFKSLGRPDYLMPFANDEGGNHFCINLNEDDYGQVYLYYTDGSNPTPLYLASSFQAFQNAIIEEQEDEYLF